MKKSIVIAFIFVLSLCGGVGSAMAVPNPIASVTQPSPQDASLCVLEEILGPNVVNTVTTAPAQCTQYGNTTVLSGIQAALGAGFNIYATACFALLGLIFSWWWMIAIVSAGGSGNATHKNVNPVWAPIRISLGMTMLGPTGATVGLCAVQFVILYMVTQGIGIADNTMKAMISAFGQSVTVNASSLSVLEPMMGLDGDLALMLACEKYFSQQAQVVSSANPQAGYYKVAEDCRPEGQLAPPTFTGGTGGPCSGGGSMSGSASSVEDLAFDVYDNNGNLVEPGGCGVISVSSVAQLPTNSNTTHAGLSAFSQKVASDVANTENRYVYNTIQQLQPIVTAFVMAAENIAQSGAGAGQNLTVSDVQNAISSAQSSIATLHGNEAGVLYNAAVSYTNQINSTVSGDAQSANLWTSIENDLNTRGWMNLGDYYYDLATAHKILALAAAAVPTMSVAPHAWTGLPAEIGSDLTALFDSFGADLGAYGTRYTQASVDPQTQQALSTAGGASGVLLRAIVSELAPQTTSQGQQTGGFSAMISVGGTFESVGEIMLAAAVGSSLIKPAAALLPAETPLTKVAKTLVKGLGSRMTFTLAEAFIVIGLVLDTVLPFLPSVLWVVFFFGWLILVLEAMLAGPMWAVAHSLPEGEGVAGATARRGYMILLNVVFRPVLGVFAFFLSVAVIDVVLGIVLSAYVKVAATVIGVNTFALFDFLAITVVFVYLTFILVLRGAELVVTLPGRIMEWIGGTGGEGVSSAGVLALAASNVTNIGRGAIRALSTIQPEVSKPSNSAGPDKQA